MIIKKNKFNYLLVVSFLIMSTGLTHCQAKDKHLKLKGYYNKSLQLPAPDTVTHTNTSLKDILTTPIEDKPLTPLTQLPKNLIEFKILANDLLIQNYKGLVVQVKNNTDRPIIFAADKCTLKNSNKIILCFPIAKLFEVHTSKAYEFKTGLKEAIPAALTIGVYPTVRDIKENNGPFLARFGLDEKRRQEQLSSFRERILWPQDVSQGSVYFESAFDFSQATLTMPIVSLYDITDKSEISVQLK